MYKYVMTDRSQITPEEVSFIKVIGVGGGGSNAANHMHQIGVKNVNFVVCNTDRQALMNSAIETKLQLGARGLGAGTKAEAGKIAALECIDYIEQLMEPPTEMVFITAGMGGGTGTGAAPVIAEAAKKAGMLTVAVVTAPYEDEGHAKKNQAVIGINQLKDHCDTVLVVLNDKLLELYADLSLDEAHEKADNVVANAVKSIAEVMTKHGTINTDFMDVKTVLENAGTSLLSTARATGPDRAQDAINAALNSPLLNNRDIDGAQRVLVILTSGPQNKTKVAERSLVVKHIQSLIGEEPEMVKAGLTIDDSLGDELQVTVIAAGFSDSREPVTVESLYHPVKKARVSTTKEDPIKQEKTLDNTTPDRALSLDQNGAKNDTTNKPLLPVGISVNGQNMTKDGGTVLGASSEEEIKLPPYPKEDDHVLNNIRKYIAQGYFSEKQLDIEPAYKRQQIGLLIKPAVPETDYIRVTLEDNR